MLSDQVVYSIPGRDVQLPVNIAFFNAERKLRFVELDINEVVKAEVNNMVALLVHAHGVSYDDALHLLSNRVRAFSSFMDCNCSVYDVLVPLRTLYKLVSDPTADMQAYMSVFPPNVLCVADFILGKLRCFQFNSPSTGEDDGLEMRVGIMLFGEAFKSLSTCLEKMQEVCAKWMFTNCEPDTCKSVELISVSPPTSPPPILPVPVRTTQYSYTQRNPPTLSGISNDQFEPPFRLGTMSIIKPLEMCYIRHRREYVHLYIEDGKLYMTFKSLPSRLICAMFGYSASKESIAKFDEQRHPEQKTRVEGLNEVIRSINSLESITLSIWFFSNVFQGRISVSDSHISCSSWFPNRTNDGTHVNEMLQLKRLTELIGPLCQSSDTGEIALQRHAMGKVCVLELDCQRSAICNVKWRKTREDELFLVARHNLPDHARLGF